MTAESGAYECSHLWTEPLVLANNDGGDQGEPFATYEAWLQGQEDSIASLASQDPAAQGGLKLMAEQ